MKLIFTRTHNNEIDIREIEFCDAHYSGTTNFLKLYKENCRIGEYIFTYEWEKIVLIDDDGREHILKNYI